MMLQSGRVFAKSEAISNNALIAGSVHYIARLDLLPGCGLNSNPALIDLDRGHFRFLPRHSAIVNREIEQVGVDILSEPVVFVLCARTELQAFARVINLAFPVINESERSLDSASGADVIGQLVGVNKIIELGHTIFISNQRNQQRGMRYR